MTSAGSARPGGGRLLPVDPDLPAAPSATAPRQRVALALVGLGGALGTLARYVLSQAWPTTGAAFPSTILVVNCSGALAIGFVLSLLARAGRMGSWRLFSCVGVLGGWTTMSSLAVATDQLIARGRVGVALVYAGASAVAGTLACALGAVLADLARRRPA